MVGSGIPPGAISCTRRFPPEATLIVAWIGPSSSDLCGSVVTAPVHVPARLLKTPNEIWAFDCDDEGCSARAGLHGDSTQMQSNNGNGFIAKLLLVRAMAPSSQGMEPPRIQARFMSRLRPLPEQSPRPAGSILALPGRPGTA